MNEPLGDLNSPVPRYKRETPMGDGCYTVSTICAWRCCRRAQTAIFDERTGEVRFLVENGPSPTREQLDAAHEEICRRFAAGEIALRPAPPFGPMWFGAAHDRPEWRLD